MVKVKKTGRRYYVTGDTYPIRAALKAAGCKWDAQAKGWWTTDGARVAQFADDTPSPASALVPAAKERRSRHSHGGTCRECRGPLRDAPQHRAMDGYCGTCAFDEFDC